jgi:hypothetical protein
VSAQFHEVFPHGFPQTGASASYEYNFIFKCTIFQHSGEIHFIKLLLYDLFEIENIE